MNKYERLWAAHKVKFIKADKKGKMKMPQFKYAGELLLQRGWK